METNLKDYEFYKLVCKTDENLYYIGSSSNMKQRVSAHKSRCNTTTNPTYNHKTYKMMRDNGGFDNFKFIIVDSIINLTKDEAHQREQEFINLYQPNMNTRNSYSTNEDNKNKCKEYEEKHKEKRSAQHKEKYKQNKEKISERYKEKITCECGCILSKGDLYKHKKTQKHINIMNGTEQLSEKSKENITCECGCIILKIHLERHKQTTKHINLMKNDELQILN